MDYALTGWVHAMKIVQADLGLRWLSVARCGRAQNQGAADQRRDPWKMGDFGIG